MTRKTFKSAYPGRSNQSLEIVRADNRVRVSVDHASDGVKGIIIAPSDAPALALAILEAAGGRDSLGIDVGNAMADLREYVTEQERITAEARERAELEAEALELCNAAIRQEGYAIHDSFSQIPTPDLWLAVARRAREIAKEATK